MDLNFIQGLAGSDEQTASSDNTMNYIVLKTTEGNITFTPFGDDRLNTVFSEWTVLKNIDSIEHQTILNMLNTCEWDKKVDFINEEFVKVEKYTAEEKSVIVAERNANERKAFYSAEKRVALDIEEDFRLDLGVTNEEMIEVKTYIKSINPTNTVTLSVRSAVPHIQRPEIMFRYDNKEV